MIGKWAAHQDIILGHHTATYNYCDSPSLAPHLLTSIRLQTGQVSRHGHAENELFLDSIWGRHCHLFHPSIRLQNITLASSPGSLIDCPLKPLHRSLFRCSILSTWPPAMIAVMLHPVMVRMTIVNAVQWLSFRTLVSAPCFLSHWYISVPTVVHPCETTWCIAWIAHAPTRLTSLQLSWRPLYFCSFSTFSWRVYPCFHRWRWVLPRIKLWWSSKVFSSSFGMLPVTSGSQSAMRNMNHWTYRIGCTRLRQCRVLFFLVSLFMTWWPTKRDTPPLARRKKQE